ncbi:MAG: VaFE repeat-containing surface-anchored protein [Lachnospiraceae bacterium]|nr:VaFE repeat-containing surface-anchored protein [Lachnospiraceae bacterium]
MVLLTVLCISTFSVGIPAFAAALEDPGEEIVEDVPPDPIGTDEADAEPEAEEETAVSDYVQEAGPDEENTDVSEEKDAEEMEMRSSVEEATQENEKSSEEAGDAAPDPTDAGEQMNCLTSLYILEHLDPAYVPSMDILDPVGAVMVYDLFVHADLLESGDTISGIRSGVTERNPAALAKVYNRRYANVALYNTDSEYYVAMIDTANIPSGGRMVAAQIRSGAADTGSGFCFDPDTGIVYIAKNAVNVSDKTSVALTLYGMYSLDNAENTATTVHSATYRNGEEAELGELQTGLFDNAVSIRTQAGLAKSEMLVSVNGIPFNADDFLYDAGTGELTIRLSACSIYSVDVTVKSTKEVRDDLLARSRTSVLSNDIMTFSNSMALLETGDPVSYAGYSTHSYTIGGNVGYCVQPSKAPPENKEYEKHYNVDDWVESGDASDLRRVLWCSYGVPGFDESYWPEKWYDGTPMTPGHYYVLSHILLTERYSSNGGEAIYGTDPEFSDWVIFNVIGWKYTDQTGVVHVNTDSTIDKISRAGDPPEDFKIYILDTGDSQNMLGWEYEPSGYAAVKKKSSDPSLTDGSSFYSLAGAVYTVYSDIACTKRVGTLTTKSDGSTNVLKLDKGTYYIKETQASTGFDLDTTVHKVTLTSDDTAENPKTISSTEPYRFGYIELNKASGNPSITDGNNGYTLAGAVYGIYTDKACSKQVDTLTTDSKGYAKSGKLAFADYYVKEISRPNGYKKDDTVYGPIRVRSSSSGASVTTKKVSDTPLSDTAGITIYKLDKESGEPLPQGSADLSDAQFTISFYAGMYAEKELEGKTPTRTWVVQTIGEDGKFVASLDDEHKVSGDDWYYTQDGEITLPLGTYTIRETAAPLGYLISGSFTDGDGKSVAAGEPYYTQIRDDGSKEGHAVWIYGGNEYNQSDRVKRGDFSFEKQDGENQSTDLGSVKFRVTSKTTGESHIFWTDLNGQYSSSSAWVPHAQQTNAGESPEDGLWFYGYKDGEESGVAPDDSLGALPYDSYILEELPCDGNEGFTLIRTEFTIYNDITDLGDLRGTVHLGTIDNYMHSFFTTATNAESGKKYLDAGPTAVIRDEVCYTGFSVSTTYTLVTRLFDVTAGDLIKDADGEDLTLEVAFSPKSKDGSITVEIPLDATGLEGHTLVVFERLCDEDGIVLEAEEDADNEDQTVFFPGIGTELTSEDGSHYADADETITLTDTVAYEGLPTSRWITMSGTLYDRETGDVLTDTDGVPVTAEKKFFNTSPSGTVEISFTFHASLLGGHMVVAGEEAYVNGILIAHHFDLKDEGQTVELLPPLPPESKAETPGGNPGGVEPGPPASKKTPPIKTGDVSIYVWVIVIAASAACLLIGGIRKRRRSKY